MNFTPASAEEGLIGFFVFVFGAILGSFLNVCIHRMPRGESIIRPGSHCPECQKAIAWYDNIPLLSFLALRAKCRHCQVKISSRYFLTELFCALMWFGIWKLYALSGMFFVTVSFFSILLAIIFTDFETGLIPDKLNFSGMVFGFIGSALVPSLHGQTIWYGGLLEAVFGFLAGGAILYATALIGDFVFKKESMGGGDIKLLAMMGVFLGWQKILLVFMLSPVLALPFAFYMKLFKKSETFPFGPFLAVTGAVVYLYGGVIMNWIFPTYGV